MLNGDASSQIQVLLAVLMLIVFVVVAAWDIYTVGTGRPDDTVSNVIRGWARVWPMLPLAVGLLMGHLFWR